MKEVGSSKDRCSQSVQTSQRCLGLLLLPTCILLKKTPQLCHCSSEQSARVKTQKELMKALKEMKIRLPSEKRSKGKSGTLATLQYALSCVKQVQGGLALSKVYIPFLSLGGTQARRSTKRQSALLSNAKGSIENWHLEAVLVLVWNGEYN